MSGLLRVCILSGGTLKEVSGRIRTGMEPAQVWFHWRLLSI